MEFEKKIQTERKWGFPKPTVLVESQSAPALIGDPAEQAYMRAFVLARETDLVVTDFPLNPTYVKDYLAGTLKFALPSFTVVSTNGGSCLSENIVRNPDTLTEIRNWHSRTNGVGTIQYFNVTEAERILTQELGIAPTSGDIDAAIDVGSKPGFRRFCEEVNLPVAPGAVCETLEQTVEIVDEFFAKGKGLLIKAENGTGGNSLKSNVSLSKNDWENSNKPLSGYIADKVGELGELIGDKWVVEQQVDGVEGSIHVYINDKVVAGKSYVIGAISEDNSYSGGYHPAIVTPETQQMIEMIDNIAVPKLQEMGVYGYHCFDFKGKYFLEDNARPGALDFVDGFVKRIAHTHFPEAQYAYWHHHVALHKNTNFDEVWQLIQPYLTPRNPNAGYLLAVTNPEVLPHGRDLDLTAIMYGPGADVDYAKDFFFLMSEFIQENI